MSDLVPERPIVRRVVFALSPGRRRQLLEVLEYIEHRHLLIDPDMYRINLEDVAAFQRMLRADDDATPGRMSLTYDGLNALDTCVMAADTYAHRKGERGLCSLTDEEFADVNRWVTEARQHFVTPLDLGTDR